MKEFLENLTKSLLASVQYALGETTVAAGIMFSEEAATQARSFADWTPEQTAMIQSAIDTMHTLQSGGVPRGTAEGLGRQALENIHNLTAELSEAGVATTEEKTPVDPPKPPPARPVTTTPAK